VYVKRLLDLLSRTPRRVVLHWRDRRITAGDYGGKLGKYHFHLHEILG